MTLELRDVSKFFGDLAALKAVRLLIEPGESVLLYGPNGAGKTTLLRTLASLCRPSEGRVLFGGEAARLVDIVDHDPGRKARENLKFTGALFGLRDLEPKIDAALDLFALRDRADEPVRGLSRGLQQRVSLARALLHQPQFLLLDEPFTGLDAEATRNLQAILGRLPEEGKAVVFSTHDFEQGAAVARRLVALAGGRVRYDGPLELAPRGIGA